ncbi:MAG: FtsX-like permease family protein [Candidatus Kerfeldbacteria bacterium]|nr:FtsX-like permease family protein [Candidatus Kerfeldbacteria bacterium]
MAYVSLLRILRFATQNFFRNFWLSLVTIFILFLTLFSITFSTSLNIVAEKAISAVKERVAVSVYFRQDALEEDVRNVQETLTALPAVKEVSYVSRDEALQLFRERTLNNPVIQETLEALGENPLGATLVVKATSIDKYQSIVALLRKPEYDKVIEDLDFEESEKVIGRLSALSERARTVGLAVSATFSIIAILVLFNTMRITIYSYREEIGIMKLVGASNWFVRAPFVVESVLYALIAGLICLVIIVVLVGVSAPYLNQFFAGYNVDLVGYLRQHFAAIMAFQLAVAVVLAGVSSLIAVGRYLRV